MGIFKKRQAAAPASQGPRAIEVGPTDVERGLQLLQAIEAAIGTNDAAIRAAVRQFSEGVGGVDPWSIISAGLSPEETTRPWRWLARVGDVAVSRGDSEFAPRAFVFCRWWFGLQPNLTINDYGDMWLDPVPVDARADIAVNAIRALQTVPGSAFATTFGSEFVAAGVVRQHAVEWVRELASTGARVPADLAGVVDVPAQAIDARFLSDLARYGRGFFADFSQDVESAYDVELGVLTRYEHLGRRFVDELSDAAVTAGGWVAVGAERAMLNALPLAGEDVAVQRVIDVATRHLQARGIPPVAVTGIEWQRWREELGAGTSWGVLGPAPAPGSVEIAPMQPGEVRHIVTLTHHAHSNRVLLTQDGDEVVRSIEGPFSHEDPRRVSSEVARSSSLWEAYLEAGESLQAPPAWVAEDFAPFMRCPPMDLSA